MDEQALAAIEAEHPAPCYCSIPWPCDVAKLVAEVRRLQATGVECALTHVHCWQADDYRLGGGGAWMSNG